MVEGEETKRTYARTIAGWLLPPYALGVLGWLVDWRAHLAAGSPGAVEAMNLGHALQYVAVLAVLVILAAAVSTSLGPGGRLWIWLSGAITILALAGPAVLMMGAGLRSGWLMCYMRATGMVPGVLLLLLWCGVVAWLCFRRAASTTSVLLATGGMVVVLAGLAIDLAWHHVNPMGNEMSMNILLLPGHEVELLGLVLGLLGAAIGSIGAARRSRA